MKTRMVGKIITNFCRDQSKWLVPLGAAAGLATTAYLSGKATLKSAKQVEKVEEEEGLPEYPKEKALAVLSLTWKNYIPTVLAGTATVGMVGFGSYSMARRTTAAISTVTLTEKAFSEYKKAVVKELGEKKERGVAETVIKKQIEANPPTEGNVIVLGDKSLTCFERHTGRYFKSDMDTLRKAENEINSRIMHELYVPLNEFYDLIGLPHTETSGTLGWDSDRLLEIEYATMLYEDVPCLTFGYSYLKAL